MFELAVAAPLSAMVVGQRSRKQNNNSQEVSEVKGEVQEEVKKLCFFQSAVGYLGPEVTLVAFQVVVRPAVTSSFGRRTLVSAAGGRR